MSFSLSLPQSRTLGCITVGRANVDMYPPQGQTLDTARRYDVFVGGSPANIAAGLAKLGISTGIITRVADDKHGVFITNYLSQMFGIDVSYVQYDTTGAATSLAFAERRPDATTIMYRHHVADLLLDSKQISKSYISQATSIVVTGTAFTQQPSRDAIQQAMRYAKESGVVCVMDIDYRPYGWQSLAHAQEVLSQALAMCDVIIGTREECAIMCYGKAYSGSVDNSTDTSDSSIISSSDIAQHFLSHGAQLVVIKKDKEGSSCFYKDAENAVHEVKGQVFEVDITKPYGAGDAFASALLGCLLLKYNLKDALTAAAASASINITGQSCTEAMPTMRDIQQFLAERDIKLSTPH